VCDTWDNALLHCDVEIDGEEVPMRLETKRLAPGETNTWFLEVLGTDGGVRFSTKEPKTLYQFERGKEQWWKATDLGHQMAFPTVTGGIFEAGFPDVLLQMLASFAAERAGVLNNSFGMATPEEAVVSHRIWHAALQSHAEKRAVELG
jgi:predicted dehydrogenase